MTFHIFSTQLLTSPADNTNRSCHPHESGDLEYVHEIPAFAGMTRERVHMPIDKTCPTGCGVSGKICETECYPALDPDNTTDGLFELKQMTFKETAGSAPRLVMTPIGQRPELGTRVPVDRDDPSTPTMNESEVDSFVANQVAVNSGRKDGLFRSSAAPYKWFGWDLSDAAKLAFNKFDSNYHLTGLSSVGIGLTVQEVMALARCKELQLGKADIACKEGLCPVEMEDGKATDGTYLFTRDVKRLEEMIAVLENKNITINITSERRRELAGHLEDLKDASEEAGDQWWKSALVGLAGTLGLGVLFIWLHYSGKKHQTELHKETMEGIRGRRVENPLERYGRNITEEAKKGELDPFIGGREIFSEMLEIVGRRKKPNPLLTGEAGVGKTSAVEGLAQALVGGEITSDRKELQKVEIWEINLNNIEADDTENRGGFEKNWKALIDQVKLLRKEGRNIWLFIDEAHLMVSAGSASKTPGLSQKAKVDLLKSGIPFIGATNEHEIILQDAAFARRFSVVVVREPTLPEVVKMVQGRMRVEELYYKITISSEVADAVAQKAPPILDARGRNLSNPARAIEAFDNILGWFARKFEGTDVKELRPEHVEQWLAERALRDPFASLEGGRPVEVKDLLSGARMGRLDPMDMRPEAARLREARDEAGEALKRVREAEAALRRAEEAAKESKRR